MAKNLYVRVKPKGPVTTFHRCGFLFGLLWVLLTDLDDATAERLQTEQMLETSLDKPEGFDEQGDAAAEETPQGLIGSDVLQAVIAYAGGFEITLGDLVAQAHTDSELSVTDWNGLPQAARNLLLDGVLTSLYKTFIEQNRLSLGLIEPAVAEFKAALEAKIAEVKTLTEKITGLEAAIEAAKTPAAAPATPEAKTGEPAVKNTTKAKAK